MLCFLCSLWSIPTVRLDFQIIPVWGLRRYELDAGGWGKWLHGLDDCVLLLGGLEREREREKKKDGWKKNYYMHNCNTDLSFANLNLQYCVEIVYGTLTLPSDPFFHKQSPLVQGSAFCRPVGTAMSPKRTTGSPGFLPAKQPEINRRWFRVLYPHICLDWRINISKTHQGQRWPSQSVLRHWAHHMRCGLCCRNTSSVSYLHYLQYSKPLRILTWVFLGLIGMSLKCCKW